MLSDDIVIEPLSKRHDRKSFTSGNEPLDGYLRAYAGQDVRRRFANCFVAADATTPVILGYYTISAASVAMDDLPETMAQSLPRYPSVPAALIGRLAVDRRYQGRDIGRALLFDAARRALTAEIAAYLLIVDAADETAAAFYRRFQFLPFADLPGKLFLPMSRFADFLRDRTP